MESDKAPVKVTSFIQTDGEVHLKDEDLLSGRLTNKMGPKIHQEVHVSLGSRNASEQTDNLNKGVGVSSQGIHDALGAGQE